MTVVSHLGCVIAYSLYLERQFGVHVRFACDDVLAKFR
jgi:hypothetical protein